MTGVVVDRATGDPVERTRVEVIGTGLATLTDGQGTFRIRGLEPGPHEIRLTRIGYFPLERSVEIRNGGPTRLGLRLVPRPMAVPGVEAQARHPAAEPSAIVISRDEIRNSGARTAAELLAGRSGLVVVERGPTARRVARIRGSGTDDVLVLVDGSPLNDPLTGDADLSSIPASVIESVTILKGGRSARYGPGAEAGVILVRTRTTAAAAALDLGSGSLGSWSGSGEARVPLAGLDWTVGGSARALDGRFEYERPESAGGGTATRVNADLSESALFIAGSGELGDGTFRLRAGYTGLERGLPGRSFLPARTAREDLARWRGQVSWERRWDGLRIDADLHGLRQTVRFRDPDPPLGQAFDSRTGATVLGTRATAELRLDGPVRSLMVGLNLNDQRYTSTELSAAAPRGRFDAGLFASGQLAPSGAPGDARLTAAVRLDRDGVADVWRATHELAARIDVGPAAFHVRHASSYSPPTFGDQFFKEGVAVEPNPDLRAERIPSELAAGLVLDGRIGSASARLSLEGYVADVDDMIVWAPDFRFVWSPRNVDIDRRGLDADLRVAFSRPGVELRAAYGLARATYDRPGEPVQVRYRPRHTGSLGLDWRPGAWAFAMDARFTGTRYPVPSRVNTLAPYWVLGLRARRTFTIDGWRLTPRLIVDRLADNEDSLIFGFPEPGRTFRFELGLEPR